MGIKFKWAHDGRRGRADRRLCDIATGTFFTFGDLANLYLSTYEGATLISTGDTIMLRDKCNMTFQNYREVDVDIVATLRD